MTMSQTVEQNDACEKNDVGHVSEGNNHQTVPTPEDQSAEQTSTSLKQAIYITITTLALMSALLLAALDVNILGGCFFCL